MILKTRVHRCWSSFDRPNLAGVLVAVMFMDPQNIDDRTLYVLALNPFNTFGSNMDVAARTTTSAASGSRGGTDYWQQSILLNSFPRDSLAAVYLGVRASNNLISRIETALAKHDTEIPIYRAKTGKGEFSISFDELRKA